MCFSPSPRIIVLGQVCFWARFSKAEMTPDFRLAIFGSRGITGLGQAATYY